MAKTEITVKLADYDEIKAALSILRAWDAWLLTDRQDDDLLAETADRTAAFFGTDRGARIDGQDAGA